MRQEYKQVVAFSFANLGQLLQCLCAACNVATRCVTVPDESKHRHAVTSLLRKRLVLDDALSCHFRSLVSVDEVI